jgi:hypothetical protein
LGITATGAIIFIMCELALVKLGAYLLNFGAEVHIIDMVAVIGYNFVPLVVTQLAELLFGRVGRLAAFAWCSLAVGWFMLRSLRYTFLPDSATPMVVDQRRTRIYFLFGVVAVQILCSYLLLV